LIPVPSGCGRCYGNGSVVPPVNDPFASPLLVAAALFQLVPASVLYCHWYEETLMFIATVKTGGAGTNLGGKAFKKEFGKIPSQFLKGLNK